MARRTDQRPGDPARPESDRPEPEPKPSRRQRRRARAAARHPAWRWTRRVLVGLAWVVGGALVLVGGALAALQTDWVQEKAKAYALDLVNEMFQGTIEVDALDGDFLDQVSLTGVRVKDPEGVVVAKVDRVAVSFDLLPLLSQRVVLEDVTVEGPWLVLQDETGAVALGRAFQPTEPAPPEEEPPPEEGPPSAWVIDVRRVSLRDGAFTMSPAEGAIAIRDLQVRGAVQAGATIRWSDLELKAALDNLPVGAIALTTTGQLAGGDVTLVDLTVDAGPHHLQMAGHVFDLANPRLDIAIPTARVDLGALLAGLAAPAAAAPPADEAATDPGASPAVAESAAGEPPAQPPVTAPEAPPTAPDVAAGPPVRGVVELRGAVQGTLDDLVARFRLQTPSGPIWLAATAGLGGGDGAGPRYDLTIVTPDLAPGAVVSAVPPGAGGRLRLHAEGHGDPLTDGEAHVALVLNGLRGAGERTPRRVTIDAHVVKGAGEATVAAEGPGEQRVTLTAKAPELPPPTPVSAEWSLDGVDLAVWGELAGRPDLRGVLERLNGNATADLLADGPANAVAHLSIGATGLRAAPSPGEPVEVGSLDVTVDATWAGMTPAGAALPTGTVAVKLRDASGFRASAGRVGVDLALDQKDGRPHAKGSIDVERVAYAGQTRVGRVTVPIDLTLSDAFLPTGNVEVRISDVSHGEMAVRTATIGGRVRSKGTTIRFQGPVKAEGIDLGGGQRLASAAVGADVSFDLASGRLDGGVDVEARDVVAGGARVKHVTADLEFSVGAGGAVTASGPLKVDGVQVGDDIRVGAVEGSVDVGLRGGKPQGNATLRVADLVMGSRRIESARLQATIDRDGKAKVDLAAQQKGFTLALDATAQLPFGRKRRLTASIARMELSEEGNGFRISPGATVAYESGRRIEADGLWIRGLGRLDGAAVGLNGTVDLRTGAMNADVDIQSVELEPWLLTLRRASGLPLLEGTTLTGRVSADAMLRGTLGEPDIQGGVSVEGADLGPLTDTFATIRLAVRPGKARAEIYANWGTAAHAQGAIDVPLETKLKKGEFSVRLPGDRPFTIDLRATGIDLELVRAALPTVRRNELDGDAAVTVLMSGTLREPLGGAHVAVVDLRYDTFERARFEADVQLGPHSTEAHVKLEDLARGTTPLLLDVEGPENLAAAIQGRRDGEEILTRLQRLPFAVELKLAPTVLGDLPLVKTFVPTLANTTVASDIAVAGPITSTRGSGWLRAEALPLGEVPGNVVIRLETSDAGVLNVRGEVSSDGAEVASLDLSVPGLPELAGGGDPLQLLENPDFLLRVTAPWLPVGSLAAFSPAAGSAVASLVRDGSVAANVLLRGAPEGPRGYVMAHVSGDHRRRPDELAALAQSVEVSVLVSPTGTEATVLVTQGEDGGFLSVEAQLPTGSGALVKREAIDFGALPLDATVSTKDFDVRGLARMAPSVFGPSTGELDVQLAIGGTLAAPAPRGHIRAVFQDFVLAAAGIQEKDFTLEVQITPEQIRLVPIHLVDDGGTFDVAFDLATPAYDPALMTMAGRVGLAKYRLLRRKDMKVKSSGWITVEGTLAAPSVTGELTVHDARLSPDIGGRHLQEIGPPEDVVFIEPATIDLPEEERARRAAQATAKVMNLDLNLTITLPHRSVHVTNDMLDLWASGDLTVLTEGGAIAIGGMILVDGGTVALYGKEFTMGEDSRVVFPGTPEINPRLNVIAHYDISDVDLSPIGLMASDDSKITVRVTGTAEQPEVELISSPAMDATNIASIMLTDSPIGGGGGDSTGATERGAANLFVGLATGSFTKMLESELPIDVLKVEGGEKGLLDARIKVGKRLTRDLLVVYEANLGAEENDNQNTVRVQYEFTRHFQLETHFGDATQGGIDLLFRWRW